MVKVFEIKPTKNAKFIQVGLQSVLDAFDQATGLKKERKVWVLAAAEGHGFELEQQYNKDITVSVSDTPHYEGQEPFGPEQKYYKCVLA